MRSRQIRANDVFRSLASAGRPAGYAQHEHPSRDIFLFQQRQAPLQAQTDREPFGLSAKVFGIDQGSLRQLLLSGSIAPRSLLPAILDIRRHPRRPE